MPCSVSIAYTKKKGQKNPRTSVRFQAYLYSILKSIDYTEKLSYNEYIVNIQYLYS